MVFLKDNATHNMMTSRILALDLGTSTGWAYNGDIIVSGVNHFGLGRFQGGGLRYLKFYHWLEEMKTETNLHQIVFEEVRAHRGVDAAHMYGGFLATLTSWCEKNIIPYEGVGVGTIKKFITGKGNASKEQVLEAVRARGYTPLDDNEADALALLLYTLERK